MLLAFVISLICNLWPILSCFRQTSCSQNCLQPFSYSTVANTVRGQPQRNEKKGRFNPQIILWLNSPSVGGQWPMGSSSPAHRPLWPAWHGHVWHSAHFWHFPPKTCGSPIPCGRWGLAETREGVWVPLSICEAALSPPGPHRASATWIKSLERLFTTENKRRRPGAYLILISKPKSKLIPQNQGI